jgi:hypothetical protein
MAGLLDVLKGSSVASSSLAVRQSVAVFLPPLDEHDYEIPRQSDVRRRATSFDVCPRVFHVSACLALQFIRRPLLDSTRAAARGRPGGVLGPAGSGDRDVERLQGKQR